LLALLLASAGFLGLGLAGAAPPAPASVPSSTAPAAALAPSPDVARLAEEYWQHLLADDVATRMGEGLPVNELPDLSAEHVEREVVWAKEFKARLDRIPAAALGHEDWLTLELLRDQADERIATPLGYAYRFLVTPYDSPFGSAHRAFTSFSFKAPSDLQRYEHLLHAYPAMVEQLHRHLGDLSAHGVLLPKPEIDVVVGMLRAYARPPQESLFEVSDDRLHDLVPTAGPAVAQFRPAVRKIVEDEINPALSRLADELVGPYRQRAPETIGLSQYPGGVAAYRAMIRVESGFDLAPEEIHRRGEAEVARLSQRMAEVRRQLGFTGTAREFNQQLRSDPRFLARTPAEEGEKLMAAVRRIEPLVPKWFLHQPKAPYGVAPLPAAMSGMTFGFYQVPTPEQPRGEYLYNTANLDQRPLVGAAALIYHELVPGHHFQLALQAENQELPRFRRRLFHTSFVEGWGEYASYLGEEMGLYDDPYSLYGRLAMDMFLSNRLVVDTGLNALGWTRQQATDFMRERLLESDPQIDSEILRYAIALPGQALAYKLGSTNIKELRHRAETELGSRFDVRRFHDTVLANGSLPPRILARHVEWWIEQEKHRPAAG
jgi:uncharacterized protein (DUF885 family)